MASTFQLDPPSAEESMLNYPPEERYFGWATASAVGFHVLLVVTVLALAYVNHVRSLREMMTASVAQLPLEDIPIILIDDNKPPPPTDNPLWIHQIVIPKDKPLPPPPPPPPKPKPQPQVVRFKPKLIVGSHNLPSPSYPLEAIRSRMEGTVVVRVAFNGTGGVSSAEVVESSGSAVLDNYTRHFILENWREVDMAGQCQDAPIQFKLPSQ